MPSIRCCRSGRLPLLWRDFVLAVASAVSLFPAGTLQAAAGFHIVLANLFGKHAVADVIALINA
jgi:hypothetical protein